MARSIASGSQGRTNRRFLLLALLLAGVSAVLVYALFARNTGGDEGSSGGAGSTQVVVAKRAIGQKVAITADMLDIKSVPNNAVVDGHFLAKDDVVGKFTKYPLEANEQVIATAIVDLEAATSAEGLAVIVPTGKRAFSIKADEVQNVNALVLPGDYVDVIWICCSTGGEDVAALAKTVLQNVQVVAISQGVINAGPASENATDNPVAAGGGDPNPEGTSTALLLTPDQEHLLFLADLTGELRLGLRNPNDTAILPASEEYTLATELLPPEVLATLPKALWPDGYKEEQ